ncbi:tetratricopeptide repeat protein [Rheinheimera sp. WS51]|uniref:tetratricopeptide repeat protein n=1 Tax=Rheinheimera sp. WS51 TaxID=3425886 RepID=UPI003D8AB5E5
MKRIKHSLLLVLMLCSACSQQPTPSKPSEAALNVPAETATAAQAVLALSDDNQKQFELAKVLMQKQNFEQAAQVLQGILNQDKQFAGVWYNLALCQWQLKQHSEAEQSLQQALLAKPGYSASLNLLGIISRQSGKFAQAEQYWLSALEAEETANAHKNLAILYELYLSQLTKAQYHYQRYYALTADPKAKMWLALIERQLDAISAETAKENL